MAAPVAINDYFSLSENRTVTGNLFANNSPDSLADYDPDGDILTIVGVSTSSSVGVDPSSIDVDYSLLTSGLVHVEANGDFLLDWGSDTPGEGMGLDETMPAVFFYLVSDGNGGFATGVVTYTIVSTSQTLNGDDDPNTINAGLGNDVVNGFGGADELNGQAGDDTLDGGSGADQLDGGAGDDILRIDASLASGETLAGGADTDTLQVVKAAGAGHLSLVLYSDTMTSIERLELASGGTAGIVDLSFHSQQFGGGNLSTSLVIIGNTVVTETLVIELSDAPGSSFSMTGFSFESWSDSDNIYLNGSTGAETLTGSSVNDTISGTAGDDILSGGAGSDYLQGGDDNDTLSGDAGADTLDGGNGIDTATYAASGMAVNANLTTGAGSGGHAAGDAFVSIENLIGSNFNDKLTGDGGVNRLTGGLGNDTLDGKAGADVMIGGDGNDTYIVDVAGDKTTETSSAGGTDLVKSSVTRTLGANLENLTLTGSGIIDGTGNTLANALIGNAKANVLDGKTGADTLSGGLGADKLIGGAGVDTLTGGGGADKFILNAAAKATNADIITDFTHGSDKIQLENSVFTALGAATGTLAAAKFFAGANAHDADDRILYDAASGKLYYDSNGNAAGHKVLIATLDAHLTITNTDFQVI